MTGHDPRAPVRDWQVLYKSKSLFQTMLKHRAAALSNGRLAVEDPHTVYFITEACVDDRSFDDPCPPTATRASGSTTARSPRARKAPTPARSPTSRRSPKIRSTPSSSLSTVWRRRTRSSSTLFCIGDADFCFQTCRLVDLVMHFRQILRCITASATKRLWNGP